MNPSEDKQSGSNKDNWMGLPHPGSPVLSHRLLNALRLDDIWHSKEALRGMIRQAAIEVAELERQASASSSCAARDAALEEAARICDRYAGGKWAAYKIGNGPDRANSHAEGESDGADECAKLIRAMKGAPVPESGQINAAGQEESSEVAVVKPAQDAARTPAPAAPTDDLYLCIADGEGSHETRVCRGYDAVARFYEEMCGKDSDGTLGSLKSAWDDPDEWRNIRTMLKLDLYNATFLIYGISEADIQRSGLAFSASTATEELPLSCEVENGAIVIRIGAKCLAHATNINPALWDAENDRGQFKVTDPVAFAKEVHRELVREEEDGSTPLTRTLDKAIYEAINQGAEGVEEASALSATEEGKDG